MRALRQLTLNTGGKSSGRNSSGRITVFHRGGGSKRLQRTIDLKRGTPSMGIVERIEYDPNRSSRIALVRWIEGVPPRRPRKCNTIEEFTPPRKILEPITTAARGQFSFSSLPGKADQRKVACFPPGLMVAHVVGGLPTRMPPGLKSKGSGGIKTCAKDVFFSAFSSSEAKGETASLSFGHSSAFPRIAVAGAKPAFFAPRMRDKLTGENTFSLYDVRKWRTRIPMHPSVSFSCPISYPKRAMHVMTHTESYTRQNPRDHLVNLDVLYNHTNEADDANPYAKFFGIDNKFPCEFSPRSWFPIKDHQSMIVFKVDTNLKSPADSVLDGVPGLVKSYNVAPYFSILLEAKSRLHNLLNPMNTEKQL